MTEVVFLDTECTGLRPDDEIWEFAGLRRRADGSTSWLHLLVEHDEARAASGLPEPFRSDYTARRGPPEARWPRAKAAASIAEFLRPAAVVVGAVPRFDEVRLVALLHSQGVHVPGLYAVVDVEALAAGYLLGLGRPVSVPFNGDELSRAVGIDPSGYPRHTAAGDVRWVCDLYDRIIAPPGGRD